MKYLVKICAVVDSESRQKAEGAAIKKIAAGGYEQIEVLEQVASDGDSVEAQRDAGIDSAIGDEGEAA